MEHPIFIDDLWWFMMVYDGLWWFMMVYDDLWWFMMVYDGLWWFMMVYDDLWWFMMVYDGLWWFMMVYDDLWWFMVIYDGLRWFMMIYLLSFMVIFQVATVAFKNQGAPTCHGGVRKRPWRPWKMPARRWTPWEWEVNVHWMFSIGKIPWNTKLTKHSGLPMFLNIGCLVSTMKKGFFWVPNDERLITL